MTTIETVYRFTHDRAAAQALLRDQKKIDQALEDTQRTAQKTAAAYTDMEQASSKAASAQKTAASEESKSRGITSRQVSSLGGLASTVGLTGLSQQLTLASDLLSASQAAKAMSGELPALISGLSSSAVAMGPAVIALAALAVGFKLWSDAAEDSREKVEDQIAAEKLRSQVATDVQDMTSEQIREQIAVTQDAINIRNKEIENLLVLGNQLEDNFSVLDDVGEYTGVANQGLDDFKTRLNELNDENAAGVQTIQLLIDALSSAEVQINDTRVAEEQLAATRLQQAQTSFSRLQDVYKAEDSYSEKQLDQRIADLKREQQALEESGMIYEQSGRARSTEIDILIEWLDISRSTIQAHDAEAEAAKKLVETEKELTASRDDEIKSASALQAERAQTNEAILDTEAQYGAESVKLAEDRSRARLEEEADYLRQRTRDLADFYADQAEQDADYYAGRNDIIDDLADQLGETEQSRGDELYKLNQDLEQAARDHGRRMREIEQSAKSEIRRGALRLDAIAIYEAQQQRKEELEAEEDQYQEQQRNREQQYRDALRLLDREADARRKDALKALTDLDRRHADERAKAEANFQQRLNREDQDRALRLARQNDQYNREDSARLASYNVQIMNLQNHQRNVENELKAHYSRLYMIHLAGLYALAAPVGGGNQVGGVPEFAGGGYTPNGLSRTHQGEYVLDPVTTRMMERGVGQRLTQQSVRNVVNSNTYGGTTIQVPGSNLTSGELVRVMDRWWDKKMAGMAGKS